MHTKNINFLVQKVEHEFKIDKIRPKFQRLPELYLELFLNKKKSNMKLASEKYVHKYEPIISSEESLSFKPIERISSIEQNKPKIGTFVWNSSESMEPSPIVKKVSRQRSSSPLEQSNSERYRKVKRSIIASYQKEEKKSPIQDEPKLPTIKEIKKTFGEKNAHETFVEYETAKDENDQKRELLFKFNRLKKTYPHYQVPEFDMLSNHDNMQRTYESAMKNLSIDSSVDTYRSYLMMGFMTCELVLGKIGFDMDGYTKQQTLHIGKYEKLLIELGEKSYVPSSINQWPVEIRLLCLILFQTTIFIVSKIILKKTDVNLIQMYNSVNGVNSVPKTRQSSGFGSGESSPLTFIPKKQTTSINSESGGKMKGPS